MHSEDRFIELETKLAFLETLVDSLGDSVTELSERWRSGREEIQSLKKRLAQLEEGAQQEILDTRPPHY